MFLQMLRAADQCAIFFPDRNSSDRQKVVRGSQRTRRRFGEEWIHVTLEKIPLELRFEQDKALPVANGFRCGVVGILDVRINDADLPNAIGRMFEALHCLTSASLSDVLTVNILRERLLPKFETQIRRIASEVDYLKLLSDGQGSPYLLELQKKYYQDCESFMGSIGFVIEANILTITPSDPGVINAGSTVITKWIERVKTETVDRERLTRAEQEARVQEEVKRKISEAEAAAAVEVELKKLEVKKKKDEESYTKEMYEISLRIEAEKNIQEKKLAEARKERDLFFNERQREQAEYEDELKRAEIDAAAQLEDKRLRAKQAEEMAVRSHHALLRQETLRELEHELQIAQARLKISQAEVESTRLKQAVEIEFLQQRLQAENALRVNEMSIAADTAKALITRLPEIMPAASGDGAGDRTLFQFGGDVRPEMFSSAGSVVALALTPIIKELLSNVAVAMHSGSSFQGRKERDSEPKTNP